MSDVLTKGEICEDGDTDWADASINLAKKFVQVFYYNKNPNKLFGQLNTNQDGQQTPATRGETWTHVPLQTSAGPNPAHTWLLASSL